MKKFLSGVLIAALSLNLLTISVFAAEETEDSQIAVLSEETQNTEEDSDPVQEWMTEEISDPVQDLKAEETPEPIQEAETEDASEPAQEVQEEETSKPAQEVQTEETSKPAQDAQTEDASKPAKDLKTNEPSDPVQVLEADDTQEGTDETVTDSSSSDSYKYDYPDDWDTNDPQCEKEYEKTTSPSLASVRLEASNSATSTTWPTYSGPSTFTHNSANTGGVAPSIGIDVSFWDGSINWSQVKACGVEYAIIRAGYRGSSNGSLNTDTKFYEYIKGAQNAGIKVGVYFFSQALNTSEARAEADYTLNLIKGYKLDLPVCFDYEDYSGGRLTNSNLSKTTKTANAMAFCERVEASGYTAMVYANSSWLSTQLNGQEIAEKYLLWMARYNSYSYDSKKDAGTVMYPGKVDMWQCSSTAQVSGISTNVDLDFLYNHNLKVSGNGAPSGVSQTAQTKNSVTISWDKVQNASGYLVYYSKSRTTGYKRVAKVSSGTRSYKITGLSQGRQYYVKVRSQFTDSGETTTSGYSAVKAVTTKETLGTRVKITKKVALRKWAGGGYAKLRNIPSGKTLRVKAVTYAKNGKVWYKVTYKGTTGYITKSKTKEIVKQVEGVSRTARRKKSVSLTWKAVPEASGYVIYRATKMGKGHYKRVKRLSGRLSKTYTDKNLKSGKQYYYKVRAYKEINGKRTYGHASKAYAVRTRG